MAKLYKIMGLATLGVVWGLLAFAGNASAAADKVATVAVPKTVSVPAWRGWCGGPAANGRQMLQNLKQYGIRAQLEHYYGIDNVNTTLEAFFADVQMATLSRSMVQTDNKGCNPGVLFDAKNRVKKPGDKMAVRGRALRAKFPDGYSLVAKPGWRRVEVPLNTLGQANCSNPGKGPGWFWVWLPPTQKQQPPRPKPVQPTKQPKAKAKAKAISTTYVRVNCPGAVVIAKATASAIAAAKATGPGASARAKAKAATAVKVICKAAKKVKKFGRLQIKKVTDPPTKGGPFRVFVRVSPKLTLGYRILGGQTLWVRNHGKDVLFPAGMRVRVCEDPVAGWITPGCQSVKIKRGLNRVTIVNRLVPVQVGRLFIAKRTFRDGVETTGNVSFRVTFGYTMDNTRTFGVPNDGITYFLGEFPVGSSHTVCETNAQGQTPDQTCITVSVPVGGLTFVFVNRTVSPPKQPPPPEKPPPPPPPCDKCGEQVPPTPAPTQGPLAPPTPPSESSAPPGGTTGSCQDPANTASCQPPPD
ncbi:hypothetical protein HYS84_03180 [Candidatus Saccharibacteria bacterium]|nr:hypothetical protein [Candidatus Saccharibacteria bacterium]